MMYYIIYRIYIYVCMYVCMYEGSPLYTVYSYIFYLSPTYIRLALCPVKCDRYLFLSYQTKTHNHRHQFLVSRVVHYSLPSYIYVE